MLRAIRLFAGLNGASAWLYLVQEAFDLSHAWRGVCEVHSRHAENPGRIRPRPRPRGRMPLNRARASLIRLVPSPWCGRRR